MGGVHFLDSNYSLKQVQIWSQEYASLSGSSANLEEWQCQIVKKNVLTKKVLHDFPKLFFWLTKMLVFHYLACRIISFLDTSSRK